MWSRLLGTKSPYARPAVLYLGYYTAFALSAAALFASVDSSAPLAVSLFIGALGLGFGFGLRRSGVPAWIGWAVGAIVVAAAVVFTPLGALSTTVSAAGPGTVILWIALLLSFGATTDDSVLFLLVPCVAMFVAGATQSSDPSLTACGLVLAFASTFTLLCHAGYRRAQTGDSESRRRRFLSPKELLLNNLTFAGLTFIVTAGLALLAVGPLRGLGALAGPYIRGGSLPYADHRRSASPRSRGPVTAAGAFSSGDSIQVGQGPVRPGRMPVLQFVSRENHYLLSRVFTDYNNQGWRSSTDSSYAFATPIPHGYVIQPDVYATRWPLVEQEIKLLAPTDVGPAFPRMVQVKVASGDADITIDAHGCIRFRIPGVIPPTYRALSRVAPPLEGLQDGPPDSPRPPSPNPAVVPAELYALAITLKGSTDVETVQHVVDYLQRHCTYDLNAPAVPAGRDAVDFFVFGSRAGYCDLFATSAAVLLQLDNIPAHYCVGYLPGQWDGARRANLVTSADAHAWIEVFISGRGWIPVDPTPPGFSGPPSVGVRWRALLERWKVRLPSLDFPHLLLIAAALMALYGGYLSLPFVVRRRLARRMALRPGEQQTVLDYWAALHAFEKAGAPRWPWETPFEFYHRLDGAAPQDLSAALESLTDSFVRVRYGQEPPPRPTGPLLALIRRSLRLREVRTRLRKTAGGPAGAANTVSRSP